MPHKQNTILTGQMEGMQRMALGYSDMIRANCRTWEGRSIEQSSVERTAWPDLFHVIIRMLTTMTKVISGLQVYPDVMLQEIRESRGTYATDEVKEFLAKHLNAQNFSAEDAYRMVQLAAFNVLEPHGEWLALRNRVNQSLEDTDRALDRSFELPIEKPISIKAVLENGQLHSTFKLKATIEDVEKWNEALLRLFSQASILSAWNEQFKPSYLLRHEYVLFE